MTTPSDVPTVDECVGNAARLLRQAEMTTDLALMERLEGVSDSWRALAGLLHERSERL